MNPELRTAVVKMGSSPPTTVYVFDHDNRKYRHCANRLHVVTVNRLIVLFEALVISLTFISTTIELRTGKWMTTSQYVGVMIGLVTWFGSVASAYFGLKYNRPILLLQLAVFKILITYTCVILILSLAVVWSQNTRYMTPAVTFHGKLTLKYVPILMPLSLGILVFNIFALIAIYKCYKYLTAKRNSGKNLTPFFHHHYQQRNFDFSRPYDYDSELFNGYRLKNGQPIIAQRISEVQIEGDNTTRN
uniref:Uncharacterized protein n=1 Tax=Romanomermis culicivorax TaxID=13658 RepID=A0A915I741_ROMCU